MIWTRYSTQIIPVNYSLLTVNVFVAATGLYQCARIWKYVPHPPHHTLVCGVS